LSLLSGVDWGQVFVPRTPLLEIVVRGSALYLTLFFLLRLVLKRQAGTLSISDLLLIVLIADAAQNGMAGDYKSITDGVLLVGVLVFWNFFLDWLSFRYSWFRHIGYPSPLKLIENGRIIRKNLREEFLTEEELMSQLREQGISDIHKVKIAHMEGDGRVSVVERSEKPRGAPNRKGT
jgi:uncharacterized membrane protein YcaP (DUF421 family)